MKPTCIKSIVDSFSVFYCFECQLYLLYAVFVVRCVQLFMLKNFGREEFALTSTVSFKLISFELMNLNFIYIDMDFRGIVPYAWIIENTERNRKMGMFLDS